MTSEFKENAEDLNTGDSVQVDVNPLDVEAIRARLDAALAHIRECMHIGLQDAKLYDEAGRKRIGEWADFIDKQIHAAVPAPEMPRPPAEPSIPMRYGPDCEHKPEWQCSAHGECRACECGCFTYPPIPPPEGHREAAQTLAPGPETPGTGSGRGTGVPEASRTAQECDCPDVDGWTIHAGLDGDVSIGHHTSRALLTGKDIPIGAVLAFIADQQPEEDDEEPDLSLIPAGLIKSDPGIRGGEPCITGTRIPAAEVAGYLADSLSWDEVREMLPSLPFLPAPSKENDR